MYQSNTVEYSLHLKRRKRRIIVGILAVIVALSTLCVLMLPADTAEKKINIYQVNYYKEAQSTLVYGGTVKDKLGGGMSFKYWEAVIVEKSTDGRLYVSKCVTAEESKLTYGAATSDGFVLLLYDGDKAELEQGQIVTVSFDYKNTTGSNASSYGTVTFGTANINDTPKDNSDLLTTVKGADTSELIEVNLYDYGENINDQYNKDKNLPGFQQDNGSTNVGTSFSKFSSFNFGNNITSDLAAGNTSVTNQGGSINTTADGANQPISGAMQATLGSDGYPALADGTSLKYLFSNNTYAEKKNRNSINGLFIYDDATGAYNFNSRKNHAQFNPKDDTFTLYEQIITSNFMMYPFGNFLPFNDIVHNTTHATAIGKDYFKSISDSTLNKYNSGYGTAYQTLSTQLTKFSALMDGSYSNGWDYIDCMNEYFKAAGINKTFDPEKSEFDKELTDKLFSIDYDIPTDFYFGMEMKMNLMQPKNGYTGKDGKQPMVFYFTGDDDVWVYLDGVLFLDLSGIHRHVGGEIDFVNGTVKYYKLDVATGDIADEPYKTVKFSELVDQSRLSASGAFTDYSMHSFNFYYIERGSGSGVCRMNFNFPLIRENSVSVTKDLDVDDGSVTELLGNPDFRFQALKENKKDLFIGADTPYDIFDVAGNKLGTSRTDENGVFVLKAGQTAVFDSIDENSGKYFVRELLDEDTFKQYGDIKIDGSSQTYDYDIMVGDESFKGVDSPVKDISDGSTVFHFNNVVTVKKLGSLAIEKTVTDCPEDIKNTAFELSVALDGVPLPVGTKYTVSGEARTVAQAGIIPLKNGEKAVISDILAGTAFEIRETKASSDGYSVVYLLDGAVQSGDFAAGTVHTETQAAVSVNNTEKGISVTLPIVKAIDAPDGKEHSYTFLLQQVTDASGESFTEPPVTREMTVNITDESVSGSFVLNYPMRYVDTLPRTLYYRITEKESESEPLTAFDKSVYIVAVTLDGTGDNVTSRISGITKDGAEVSGDIKFINRIERYELPATGGIGVFVFYIAGGVLLLAAVIGLLYIKYNDYRKKK